MKYYLSLLIIAGGFFLAITIGCLGGGYLPNHFYNQRVELRSCHVFMTVGSQWCRVGSTTKMCYTVFQDIKPNQTTCWRSITIAWFDNEQHAQSYANQWPPYYRPCYWDYKNPCEYSWDLADVVNVFWAGIVFGILFGLVAVAIAGLLLRDHCRHGKLTYDELEDTPE